MKSDIFAIFARLAHMFQKHLMPIQLFQCQQFKQIFLRDVMVRVTISETVERQLSKRRKHKCFCQR